MRLLGNLWPGLVGVLIIGGWVPAEANVTCGKPSKCSNASVVAQVRAAVDAACPCNAATAATAYAKCWKAVLKARVKALGKSGFPNPCRTAVRRALTNSICGRADAVLCRKITRKGAEICRVAKASKCADAYEGVAVSCVDACACSGAKASRTSVGCEFFATSMDVFAHGNCFAVYVVNTWPEAAHIAARFQNFSLPVESFTRIPSGSGSALTLSPYDAAAGVPPGGVAVMFLGGGAGAAPLCPVTSAVTTSSFAGTGLGSSFEITTDVPVAAYQINPFGGGAANFPGASLLLPTSVWDTSYVAVNAFPQGVSNFKPSLNIVASANDTSVTIVPTASVVGGNGVPNGNLGQPLTISLAKGQNAQITQTAELTGSVITANKPIGFMAGHPCMNVPVTVDFCDHGEQMIPPTRALGSTYVGVMHRPRAAGETQTFWRVVGVVDGTQLTYSTAVGGPPTLDKGETAQFVTGIPFVVSSQDAAHPFMLFQYMTGSEAVAGPSGLGDPDFVTIVPPDQYLDRYVFFTDPTYPETNLVVVRKRDRSGDFHDVVLDCSGTLTGWQAIGNDFEFTRVDLTTGNFQNVGSCSSGRREMHSALPFGLWVWGWGTNATTPTTRNVSYGYPGGMKVQPINTVVP